MPEGAHSRFGGSKADRWLNCPGSVALCASVPALPSSPYAAEGTMAHEVAEWALKNGYDNAIMAAADMPLSGGKMVTREMCEAVQVYLDAVYEELTAAPDAELFVESKFVFSMIGDGKEVYGSNDAIVHTPSRKRVAVFDYKHGVGVSVTADDNAQLKFYAAGAILGNDWIVTGVELIIVQPRARDADEIGAIRRWPMDVMEVLNFTGELALGVERAKRHANILKASGPGWKIDGILRTGSWCRWCEAAAICPAKEAEVIEAVGVQFEGVHMIDATGLDEPSNMDPERLARVLKGINVLNAWASQIQEFVEAHMLAGTMEIPGWKVVDKIGRAKWVANDQDVAAYASVMFSVDLDDILPRRLVTISDAEKTLKRAGASREEIDDFKLKYTIKESSGLTIAPIGDRRPAVDAAARNFDGVKVESE